MKTIVMDYKTHLKDKRFLYSALLSIAMLAISFSIMSMAITYATNSASSAVTDIILSNIRVYDVDGLFAYGGLILVIAMIITCLLNPKRLPFTVKSISLFIIIRSVFVTLTHLGPFVVPTEVMIQNMLYHFSFGGDLFFSGHTGLPFLMALLFWDKKPLRYLYLAGSIFFAVIVLLGHFHYSIDVLAAFFITYAIVDISKFFFKQE